MNFIAAASARQFPPPLRGRVREGGIFVCSVDDSVQHAGSIFQNIGIPETKYPITLGGEPAIAFQVSCRIGMLSSVEFNNQPAIMADEINNETPDRRLATKAQAVQSVCAQRCPQARLSVRHLADGEILHGHDVTVKRRDGRSLPLPPSRTASRFDLPLKGGGEAWVLQFIRSALPQASGSRAGGSRSARASARRPRRTARRSGMPYFSMAMRSIPMPQAKP